MTGKRPGAILPGGGAKLPFLGNGIVGPAQLTGAHIEGVHITAEGFLVGEGVGHRLPNYHHIADHHRHAAPTKQFGSCRHQLQVGTAVDTKAGNRLSIVGIECVQESAALNQNASIVSFAPVGNAARSCAR